MIFQYNDIIPQRFAIVKFLNKNSVKNNSENNFFNLMTVIDSIPQVSDTITHVIMHRGKCRYCCAFHKNSYRFSAELDSWFAVVYNVSTIKLMEVTAMLKISELAMQKSRKVTTVCNGKREVWADYEEAKAYFLELMMSTDGEEHERAECVYIQLLHGLDECSDED